MIKNIFKLLAFSILAFAVSSCAKEEIGGTAVQDMAGEWYVIMDYTDEDGNVIEEDTYDLGYNQLYTYNTNANLATEMYVEFLSNVEDNYNSFRVIADVNYGNKTFSATDVEDDYYGYVYTIKNGKVVKDGAISPAGYKADAISFTLIEEYDYNGQHYVDYYLIHGYRRTGLDGGYD